MKYIIVSLEKVIEIANVKQNLMRMGQGELVEIQDSMNITIGDTWKAGKSLMDAPSRFVAVEPIQVPLTTEQLTAQIAQLDTRLKSLEAVVKVT